MYLYDTEVFFADWIIVFHNMETGQKHTFHNDNYAAAEFIDSNKKPVIGGYNTKHYDQWILKAIYWGADNATVKELNDFIITDNKYGWDFPFLAYKKTPWVNFDLMDDIPVPLRLKEIEGNLGMDIRESEIPFDIDRPLTEEELEETIPYCSHDVDATVKLFHERSSYLLSKITVGRMAGLGEDESLHLTNAKLTAAYLKADRAADYGDETVYDFPDNLKISKYPRVLEFFSKIDPAYKSRLDTDIAGTPHTIRWGGLHGALSCYHEKSTGLRKILHIDVTSYYPSLMIQNGYMSRNVPDPGEFRRVYERRIEAKAAGDKSTADALKLVLNTTYGAMKEKHNPLYDPRMANAVCISGQLYLIDLIEKLESIPTFRLIQSNTDGLIISCDTAYLNEINTRIAEWEDRTGFKMGRETVERIYQKDVNNYILLSGSKVEVKGGYVSNYDGGDFRSRSLVIVARAVVDKVLYDIPVETTVNGCVDKEQFQIICKAGGTYDGVIWGDKPVQRVNRVFASKDITNPTLYKLKSEKNRRDKIAGLPEHCIIDNGNTLPLSAIDRQFYIDTANKRINDYLGTNPAEIKKEGQQIMLELETKPNPAGLAAKLMTLRKTMDSFAWEKDGINRAQSYQYITEAQYKKNFKEALAAARLDFSSSVVDYQYIGPISEKMNMVIAKFEFRIIDRGTGDSETFTAVGSGADMGDKGIYKAYTGALKYFLANNYLVAEGAEPEADEEPIKPRHVTPERREEIKDTLRDQEEPATEQQLEAIALGAVELERLGADADIVESITAMLEVSMTKAEAEGAIDVIRDTIKEHAAG